MAVSRNRDESGRVYFIYPVDGRGEMLICTGTLPIREQPYELLTELARGTLNRLRNQISIWQEGGLTVAETVNQKVDAATKLLSASILGESSLDSDATARKSIQLAMDAIFELSDSFGEQISKFRREHNQLSNFWLANVVGKNERFKASLSHDTFDLIEVNLNPECTSTNEQLASGHGNDLGKRIILGPWLDASVGGMSQSLIEVDDYLARKDQLLIECRRQLDNLPKSTSLIHVAQGLNGIGHRHLSYPQQLQATVDMLRLVEDSLIEQPTMISFDFPWAERLAGAVGGVHPLQIADSLMRQGLSISFLGLDINLDYWPNGSAIRDPLQWIDLVDVWAQLGLPLIICLRLPTGAPRDMDATIPDRSFNQTRSNLTDRNRLDYLETVLPMLAARPSVHGLIWNQWSDSDDPRYPHGGIVDAKGNEKTPIMETIARMRAVIQTD